MRILIGAVGALLLSGCANFDAEKFERALLAANQYNQAIQPRPYAMAPMAYQAPVSTAYTPPAPSGPVALWTGRQEAVTTVTYKPGVNCQYNYLGQMFWRTFVGTCPATVPVQ